MQTPDLFRNLKITIHELRTFRGPFDGSEFNRLRFNSLYRLGRREYHRTLSENVAAFAIKASKFGTVREKSEARRRLLKDISSGGVPFPWWRRIWG